MKRSLIIGSLILVLILASATAFGYSEVQMSEDIRDFSLDMADSLTRFSNGNLSQSSLIRKLRDYTDQAESIYLKSLNHNLDPRFIKIAAGLSLVVDNYYKGFRQSDIERVKAGNSFLNVILIPAIKDLGK